MSALTKAAAWDYMDERKARPPARKNDSMVEIIDHLLAAGADPNIPSRYGTPLELARSLRCRAVVGKLKRAVKK